MDYIFDVGMYDGLDTLNYLRMGFRVIAIEANPELCKKNRYLFRDFIKKNQLIIVNKGIGDKYKKMKLYIDKLHKDRSTFLPALVTKEDKRYKTKEIKIIPFSEIINRFGVPFYLKIDIEGFDKYCLKPFKKNYKPKYISLEFSNKADIKRLKKLGYNKFKFVDQSNIKPKGSSGGFGKDAIDVISGNMWRSYYELVCSVDKIFKKSKYKWFDVHVTY